MLPAALALPAISQPSVFPQCLSSLEAGTVSSEATALAQESTGIFHLE